MLGDVGQRLLIKYFVLVLVELHELVQVQDRLEHRPWLVPELNGVVDAPYNGFFLLIVQDAPDGEKGDVVEVLRQ